MVEVVQPSFAGGELGPALYGRVDIAKFQVGLRLARNVIIRAAGGVSNRPGTQWIGEVKDSAAQTRLIPFQFNTEQTYVLEFGNGYIRIITGGGYVVESGKAITSATQANPVVVTSASHGFSNGEEVFISGVAGMTTLNGRTFRVTNVTANTFELTDLGGANIDGTGYGAYTSGGTAARVLEVSTSYTTAQLRRLQVTQSADTLYICHPSHAPRKLTRSGATSWTLSTLTFAPSIGTPTGENATASADSGSRTYTYRVSAIADDSGEEGLASSPTSVNNDLSTAGNTNTITWNAVSGAARYAIYKQTNGVFGYIGTTDGTSFIDGDPIIDADISDTPQQSRNPFGSSNNYPAAVQFFEQRLIFAATNNKPQTVYASQSASFENFAVSVPVKDADAITVTLAARQVNEIRHMIPLEDLIVLTSGGEWRLTGGSADYITPSDVLLRPQGYRGSAYVPPIVVGSVILFVQEKGTKVRDLGYSFEFDGYVGNDLTVLSPHFFENHTILEWAFAQEPFSLVWAVRDDGKLLCLTYQREHNVWAWTQCETDGEVESVAAIGEGSEDVAYLIVKRTVNGRTVRYVERVVSPIFTTIEDAWFLDSALQYSGAATNTVSGLHHLEGKTVYALADGNVVRDLTVTDGSITLAFNASKITVGLPYTATIQTLPADLQTENGSTSGRFNRIGRLTMRVLQTRGIFAGPSLDRLVEYKQRQNEPLGAPIDVKTGDIQIPLLPAWAPAGDNSIYVRQTDPLPMTILSMIPDVIIGG